MVANVIKLRLFVLYTLFLCTVSKAQTTHYLHYTTNDGLPSNKIYCATQDASGFIWLGTDNGLVRYNGSEFKTFTVKDGLPDNDIFTVFEDHQKRLWILGFKQSPCYFFKNKLYTSANDSFLSKYFKNPDMFRFTVNRNLERIIFYTIYENKFTILEYNHAQTIQVPKNVELHRYIKAQILNLFNSGKNDYLFHHNDFFKIKTTVEHKPFAARVHSCDQIKIHNENIGFYYDVEDKKISAFNIQDDSVHIVKKFNIGKCIGPFTNYNNELIFIHENGEIYSFDSTSFSFIKENSKVPEGRMSTAFIDKRGNKWICTHDNGVYVYPKFSSEIISSLKGATCFTINPENNEIITGFENKSLFIYSFNQQGYYYPIQDRNFVQSRITSLVYYKGGVFIGGDFNMGYFNIKSKQYQLCPNFNSPIMSTIKDMELCQDGRILIGSANGAGFFSADSGKLIEKLWETRSTAVCCVPDRGVFIGTVNGLHYRPKGQKNIIAFISNTKLDKARITDIKYDKAGRIWVGTAQYGLFIIDQNTISNLDDDRVSKHFITSYSVNCIFIDHSDIVWVGTDKGINRIIYKDSDNCKIFRITSSFGIPNDNIRSILVADDKVYLTSLDGISRFNFNPSELKEVPGLEITSLIMNGKNQPDLYFNTFNYNENNIVIEYSGIAFRSIRNLEYEYKFAQTDQDWIRTKGNRLDLFNLKPGNYIFEIRCINTISAEISPIRHLEFTILKPWYLTWWFIIGLFISCTLLISYFIIRRINLIKKRSEEKSQINKQIAELEMQALRAQMNPHFIFNALSAIQYYFVSNKEEKANAFMSRFAKLIRQMLDYSQDNFIPLEEEISLINNYMNLEKMRFEDKLDFSIHTDPRIDIPDFILPSLLLQPILENSVNHGIMPLKNNGMIHISFKLETQCLTCEISDNGIGIKQSKQHKTQIEEHLSRGINIMTQRIDCLNQFYNSKLRMEIIDLSDIDKALHGTLIRLYFPLSLVNKTTEINK